MIGVQGRVWARGAWLAAAIGCGDKGGTSDSASGTGTSTGGSSGGTEEPTTTGAGACIDEAGAPVFEHEGVIGDETWAPGVHLVTVGLTVNGLLVVEPCSVIKMPNGGTIRVEDGGAIQWAGTAELPIRVTSAKPTGAPGDWGGVEIYASSVGPSNVVQHVTFEYGGASIYGSLWVQSGASIEVRDSTFTRSGDFGIMVEGGAELRDFTNNTLTNNAKGAAKIAPQNAGQLLAGTYSPNEVEGIVLEGPGVDADQTWLAHDAPYVAPQAFEVGTPNGSAQLTIAAGATIKIGDGATVRVRDNAGLTMIGTASQPITFTSAKSVGAPGDWGQIEIYSSSADDLNVFDHVIVEHGGGSIYGQVWLEGGASAAIRNTTIRSGSDVGLSVEATAELREFMGNTITDNAKGALTIGANEVDQLLDGTYGPNGVEGILIDYAKVDHDALWLDHAVPYLVNAGFTVGTDAGSALLEVEAGSELRVADGMTFRVETNGGLRLSGVDGNPVIVTSAKPTPAPGDWAEIDIYDGSVGPENVFSYAEISYGGGSIYGQVWVQAGAEVTLDHVTFSGAGMGCDVDEDGTVQPISTNYVPCM